MDVNGGDQSHGGDTEDHWGRGDTEDHWGTGNRLYSAGRVAEAAAEWSALLQATPEDADLQYNVGLALSELGREEEAVAHWREAIRLRPDFFEPHYALPGPLIRQIREDKSKGNFLRSFSRKALSPKNRALWEETRILCRQALSLNPSESLRRAAMLRLLGQAEWELGDRRAGLAAMEAAVAAAPDNLRGYERLSAMQQKSGMWRATWRTTQTLLDLPTYADSPNGKRVYREARIVIGVLVAGGALLVWKMTRKR